MAEKEKPEENLGEEFQNLGMNLLNALRTAWDNPDRKRMQDRMVQGLNDLGITLKHEAETFSGSSAGKQIKSEFENFGERLQNSEVQEKIRQELLNALRTANFELEKVIEHWSASRVDNQTDTSSNDTEQ